MIPIDYHQTLVMILRASLANVWIGMRLIVLKRRHVKYPNNDHPKNSAKQWIGQIILGE
jgi:hypothetical protein